MTRPRLQRDELTHAGYAVLTAWAWFLYGFGAILPLLRAEQGTSRTVLGLHSVALACGGLVAGALAVPVIRRLQRRGALVLGSALVVVGVAGLVLGPGPAFTIGSTMVAGTGGSMMLNTIGPSLTDHHGGMGAAVLSEGNAVAATIGLVSPLAIWGTTSLGWTWRPAALVELPFVVVLLLLVRRVPAGTAAVDAVLPPRTGARRPLVGVFRFYLVLLMACVAIEFCCSAWSADLLRQRTGVSAGAASIAVTAVVSGMAVGRFTVGRLALRHPPARLLAGALAVTAVGWVITWLSSSPAPAVAGLFVIGLGIAGHFPLAVSMAYAAVADQIDQASGAISLGLSAAIGVAPFGLGALADATSTHTAFVVVPVLLAVAGTALWVAGRSVARTAAAPA